VLGHRAAALADSRAPSRDRGRGDHHPILQCDRLVQSSDPDDRDQAGAVQVDDKIVLTFTTVLDIYEEPEEEGEGEADRDYWEKRSNPESLRIVDQCVQLLSTDGHRPRLTYHRGHITMGGNRQHFAWFHPRRVQK